MSPFSDICEFLSHLGDAIANLALGLNKATRRSYETFDYVAARRMKISLTKLHKFGSEFGVMQNMIPSKFLWYMNDPTPNAWDEVKSDLRRLLDAIPEIAQDAAKADGAFVLEPAYKAYFSTMRDRHLIIKKLLETEAPLSQDEISLFSKIREEYVRLMDQLEACQAQLSEYIRRKFPNESAYLENDELPTFKPDKRSRLDPLYRDDPKAAHEEVVQKVINRNRD